MFGRKPTSSPPSSSQTDAAPQAPVSDGSSSQKSSAPASAAAPRAATGQARQTPAYFQAAMNTSSAKGENPMMQTRQPATPSSSQQQQAAAQGQQRRVMAVPGAERKVSQPVVPAGSAPEPQDETRRLTVGRSITLTGEITNCDVLIVEGQLEATVREARMMEITETGAFRGNAEIDEAIIGGRFEGVLSVRGRLVILPSGRVAGRIQYGELEVRAGGQVMGELQVMSVVEAPSRPVATVADPLTDDMDMPNQMQLSQTA
jgi:cytoskeletal protein CcmA (bactofilin family)